ncbi:caspase family protein [Crocosphaera watsonii]|nr:caspase family protein [Crocosphaera watsonii]
MSTHEFKRSLAVVIGINHYSNGIQPLETPKADAEELAKILEHDHHYHQVILVTDDTKIKPTRNNLLTLLKITLTQQNLTERDRLLFYFAGHGIARPSEDQETEEGPQGFLVPSDAHYNQPDSLISMRDIYQNLAKLNCRHLLVILDCCFAGAFRWASTRRFFYTPKKATKAHYERFTKFPAWEVITSSAYNQEALDFLDNREIKGKKTEQHSPFAQALFQALKGKADLNNDGVIIAPELYIYLRDYVEKNAHERQTPGFFPLQKHDRGEYIFLTPEKELSLAETPLLNPENNPYRGLKAFDEEHSRFFFGRQELIEDLFKRVSHSQHRLTTVVGISGSGKSSLVKAGLIPCIRQDKTRKWQLLGTPREEGYNKEMIDPIRPGKNPYFALAQAFSVLQPNQTINSNELKQWSEKRTKTANPLSQLIKSWSKNNPDVKLLLIIDQFEELITLAFPTSKISTKKKRNWWNKLQNWVKKTSPHKSNSSNTDQDKEALQQQWMPFLELLANTLEECPQLNLVVTLRSDFAPRFANSGFKSYWEQSQFTVRPMRSDELREAVLNPATENALYFEPPELVDTIVDEVSQMPGALPLLSFTLSELYINLYRRWQNKESENRALTLEDYQNLGGVAGSLTRRANEEYEKLSEFGNLKLKTVNLNFFITIINCNYLVGFIFLEEYLKESSDTKLKLIAFFSFLLLLSDNKHSRLTVLLVKNLLSRGQAGITLRHLMLRMVEIEGGEAVKRRVLKSELIYPSAEENERVNTILQALVNARLIITGEDSQSGEVYYEPAHDFLVRSWDKLQDWLREEQENLVLRKFLTPASHQWSEKIKQWKEQTQEQQKNQNPKLFLWDNDPKLDLLQQILYSENNWQNQLESQFVKKSCDRRQFKRNRTITIAIGISAILSVITLFAVNQQKKAELRRDIALVGSLLQTEPTQGLVLAIASLNKSKQQFPELITDAESILLNAIQNSRETNLLRGHKGEVYDLAVAADDKKIISGGEDGKVILWDLEKKTNQIIDDYQNIPVHSVSFNQTGQIMASASKTGRITVRNLENQLLCSYQLGDTYIQAIENGYFGQSSIHLEFSPQEENLLISASADGKVIELDFKNCHLEQSKVLYKNKSPITSLSFSPDGKLIAIGDEENSLKIFDINTNPITSVLENNCEITAESINSIAFNPNDKEWLNTIILGKIIHEGDDYAGIDLDYYEDLDCLDYSKEKIINSRFTSLSIYYQVQSPSIAINSLGQIAIAGRDWENENYLFLLDSVISKSKFSFKGHLKGVNIVAFTNNGKNIISGGQDGTIRIWDTESYSDNLLIEQLDDSAYSNFTGLGGSQYKIKIQNNELHKELKTLGSNFENGYFMISEKTPTSFYSSDGKYLATLEPDNSIYVETSDRKQKYPKITLKPEVLVGMIAISSQSQRLAILTDRSIKVITFEGDLVTEFDWENQIYSFGKDEKTSEKVIAINNKGDLIVVGVSNPRPGAGINPNLYLLNLNGQIIGELSESYKENYYLVDEIWFSYDDQYIFTGSSDNVRVFPGNSESLLKIACHRLKKHSDIRKSDFVKYCQEE